MALYMKTFVSRSTSDILAHLSHIQLAHSPFVTLFALSAPPVLGTSSLSSLVAKLTSLSDSCIGALSAPIPSAHSSIACSIALFDKRYVTPFRSTIPGRQAAQVGRWHAFRTREDDAPAVAENGADCLKHIDAKDVSSVVFLSDGAPEGLCTALQAFPSAHKLGLVASSTPFVTGRPYTLFHGKSVHSSGAVGLCLSSPTRPRGRLSLPKTQALTEPLVVTQMEGNLIYTLNDVNPTRLLLSAIERNNKGSPHGRKDWITKDDQFYLGVLRQADGLGEIQQVYHITSGDPSRGTLAVESEHAPAKSSRVQFFHVPATSISTPDVLSHFTSSAAEKMFTLAFSAAPSDETDTTLSQAENAEGMIVLEDTFLAASENGLIVDPSVPVGMQERRVDGWKCTMPGSAFSLEWHRS
ncbi:hypothetical protein WOLCODRAFT_131359 [Wolfiporia cocos MD-104 SS10]|uniref:FIST domain-containing protein n=1 Tax=Wolfiporia cocos (strain MD-104) TaxID=742152 RepID=A0A2H3JRE1_WOLCO|nr:hypothetical protein WOLCODRAFT_131359 [Wolfiporia cocos MD-104 SS10]